MEKEEFEIQAYNFEKNKELLKRFAGLEDDNIYLGRVSDSRDLAGAGFDFLTKGPLSLFDNSYKVKGEDLNNLTRNIEDVLIKFNERQIETRKEFETIYNTFEALHEGYLKYILDAIEENKEREKEIVKLTNFQMETIKIIKTRKNQKNIYKVLTLLLLIVLILVIIFRSKF